MADTPHPVVREDGALINLVSGLGTAKKDKSVYTQVGFNYLLGETELEQLYIDGIPRRYVDAIPDELLRHQVSIKLSEEAAGDDTVETFEEYLKGVRFHAHYSEVVRLQRLYGGAGLVLFIDDGLEAHEPVDFNKIRSFRGMAPLSRHELIPYDTFAVDRSQPEQYRITTSQKLTPEDNSLTKDFLVHSSRVARFDGLYLPRRRREFTHGWGQSCIQLLWTAFKRYESAMAGLENMVGSPDTFVHKVPGLMNMLIAGNEQKLMARLEVNNLARSLYGGMLLDTEEEVDYLQRTLQNLAAATEPFMKELQAATGWPASILMGESPGGLGKEGRFEERVWASLVEQWQEVYCRDPITQIFTTIMLSKDGPTKGTVPPNWQVHFPSIFTQTNEEKATLLGLAATADTAYINSGVLTALEVRQSRFSGTEFSLETNLDDSVTEQLAQQQWANHQTTMLNYQMQADAMLNPPEPEGPGGPAGSGGPGEQGNPAPQNKTDSPSFFEQHGYRIRVTHKLDAIHLGELVGPDNQRIDADRPLRMILGPVQTTPHDLYRVRFARNDELIDGPYAAGFKSIEDARKAAFKLFPGQTVAGLTRVSPPERDSLRAAWEAY